MTNNVAGFERDFMRKPELRDPALAGQVSQNKHAPLGMDAAASQAEIRIPAFPEAAWRGVFATYRTAMCGSTEASDAFHFATLWARLAVAVGRKVWFEYGLTLFANVYLLIFGPTNDRKTTAIRRVDQLGGGEVIIVRGVGSGEGLAEEFSRARRGEPVLIFTEEFSELLRRGRWEGATLIPFLTNCFDCPQTYELKFRKSPVRIEEPTPNLLASGTPTWFWRDVRREDFAGGFGNRIFYLTGKRKPPIALPRNPDLREVQRLVGSLSGIYPGEAKLSTNAERLWNSFYESWDADSKHRDDLLESAIARIPSYVLKLAMTYAAAENTLPEIQLDQLAAAILVGDYAVACTRELLSLQNEGSNVVRDLEKRILAFIHAQPSGITNRRAVHKSLHRHYASTEQFNRAFDSLVRAGEIFTKPMDRGSTWVSTEPL